MLSDPFLQLPTENSIRVVWFTEFPGCDHKVVYGNNLNQKVKATTSKLTRVREDQHSYLERKIIDFRPTKREIWRHEAEVGGLTSGQRLPYQVISTNHTQEEIKSSIFTLTAKPQPNSPLKILLTSDHQLMPMTTANLQKVAETIGQVDAIFFAGDLVNVPDRASEWFDDSRGGAFFPALQGRANYQLEKNGIITTYKGGELIQHAPLFPAIGNHEVMGQFSQHQDLKAQFNNTFPRHQAQSYYQQVLASINPEEDPLIEQAWLKAHSFNTDTYEEIFSLPQSISGGKKYYSLTFGDIWLGVLFVTNMWRSPFLEPHIRGRYQEKVSDLHQPHQWGYGQHIYEPIKRGSSQYQWLEEQLKSPEFLAAKYKMIMFHHPPHCLGGNIVPPYTDPIAKIEYAENGTIKSLRYEYPQKNDYIIRDLIPLLDSSGVNLVFYGHCHLWNRFISTNGMHFLESSNVGNTYGAHIGEKKRPVPQDNPHLKYAETGNPNGLEPIIPTISPLMDNSLNPLPYIASNDMTVFSILDTHHGTVTSYRFDTSQPESAVVKFDEFVIGKL